MASQGRFAARLARLPHDTLAELAASLCCTNDATRRTADSTLALHDPTPAWAIERILTSPDLVQCIFAHVEMQDHAGARVCKAWKRGWDATDGQRRGLRPAELAEPDFDVSQYKLRAELPGDRLCLTRDDCLRIVDSNMQTLKNHHWMGFLVGGCTVSEDAVYAGDAEMPTLRRYRLGENFSLSLQVEYEDTRGEEEQYRTFFYLTTAPDGVLFALGSYGYDDDGEQDEEIVAFDATTLTVRKRFGRGLWGAWGTGGMAIVGDELYVSDSSSRCIRVFSMSGEHLRVIGGDWRQPERLLFVRDRLYLFEEEEPEDEEPEDETAEEKKDRLEAGKRIFVLTPQGETLQKYVLDKEVRSMAVLGDKLIVRTGDYGQPDPFLALKGL